MSEAEQYDMLDNDVEFMRGVMRQYAEKLLIGVQQMPPPQTQAEVAQAVRVLALYLLKYEQYRNLAADQGELEIKVSYEEEAGW